MAAHPPSFTILVIAGLSNPALGPLPPIRKRRLVPLTRESPPRVSKVITSGDPEWLGLNKLIDATEQYSQISVKIWDVSKRELLRDLQRAPHVDQSVLFKKVYAESLGTFGEDPIGLILADLYLTPDTDDISIAEGVGSVAAAAGAPALIGVSPDFPITGRGWFADCGQHEIRYLFPLLPRWRGAADSNRALPWQHTGYLIAARIAAALRSCDLTDAASLLLPSWVPARAAAFAATAADVLWNVEFESTFDGPQCYELRNAGVNVLSVSSCSQPDTLVALTPAVVGLPPGIAGTLAHLLLKGLISHRLQSAVRRHRINDGGSALVPVVQDWFSAHNTVNKASEPLVQLRHVAIVPNKLLVSLSWHPQAEGAHDQIELDVPGIFDDRIPTHYVR